ncbi:hypothetical protein PT7_1135 [Pusillimonas sp. T7-7]|uniref:type II secretion system protein N n=1 Tax=Pusillimonas sp. (strain T7-7) TaxID=1007105 RepID=UPI000208552B|nr:type II secretion system protein N [Pusillimonas sp. T7-7]AEC19675.1 hypothetical protein PT7_1135 [Pusillimonas sp. T7-7]
MGNLPTPAGVNGPNILRSLAIVVLAAGIGVWSALLLAPVPRSQPPALDPATPSGQDISAVANWFGGAALRVPISLAGLISAKGERGAALLSINGASAQAYRVGQVLAPGVTLAGVSAQGVSIDQDGVIEQLNMPANPFTVVQGFIPVASPAPSIQP